MSVQRLQSEVERLKAQVKALQAKQLEKAALRGTKARLRAEKKGLKRVLHPRRALFSDFVKAQFAKGKDITFKQAVKLAKQAWDNKDG